MQAENRQINDPTKAGRVFPFRVSWRKKTRTKCSRKTRISDPGRKRKESRMFFFFTLNNTITEKPVFLFIRFRTRFVFAVFPKKSAEKSPTKSEDRINRLALLRGRFTLREEGRRKKEERVHYPPKNREIPYLFFFPIRQISRIP